ncbi:hypothetical protein JZK55_13900 [Dissulfurispira thermophila]|uniref:Flagellar hook-length control protein-like C-terminal domain-containing protein n=2 Tax=root TaxID=1 RepID=A0A7G1H1H1_9BACT|nr:flagellar hook-length control protein FliK [Dissulfurispira thermophila]BCB96468.1 hypothetical protein JZK55_13900 [Dissulfurispira thermophila]
MFVNIIQSNIDMGNAVDNPAVGPFPNMQIEQTGQSGFDANSFIAIITAILSGLNNTTMLNAEGSLFAGKDSQSGSVDDVPKGLLVGEDNLTDKGDGLSDILYQMIAQMQLIGTPQSIVPIQDNQKTPELSNGLISQVQVNGNAALVNLIMNSEDVSQKIKVHTNANFSTNDSENEFSQIKTIADAVNGQGFQKTWGAEHGVHDFQLSMHDSQSTTLDTKTNMQKALSSESQMISGESQMLDVKLSHDDRHLKHDAIASVSHFYNIPSNSNNEKDSTVLVKEPIHITRLHELGELMGKTVKAGDNHLVIKIEPPDLGSIQIKLRMDNGMLRADLKVDSSAVKDLFSMAIPQIKTSLEDSGIKVSDFFVDVKDDHYSDSRRQQDDTNQQNKQHKKQENFFDYFV